MSKNKQPKKIGTNEESVTRAEDILGITYPLFIREFILKNNGGMLGFFERMYPVKDDEDVFHTFNDVVRENEKSWKGIIPEGFVAIGDDAGGMAMALSTAKDGKVYTYLEGEIEVFAENDEELRDKIAKQEEEMKEIYGV